MREIKFQADLIETGKFLKGIIEKSADEKAINWLDKNLVQLQEKYEEKQLFMQFSMASRFFDKGSIKLSGNDINKAGQLREGFDPKSWNVLQTARTLILLTIPYADPKTQLKTLDTLYESADVAELVALYAALPLFPNPLIHVKRAAEGIRTNMTVVLDAVTLNNPFPAQYFDEISWNQLVLKCIFTERPVYQIYHADRRANERLASTLSDYAHERWAAGREVSPELWRFTGKFVNNKLLSDYAHLLERGNKLEKNAAYLACKDAHTTAALQLIGKEELEVIAQDWNALGQAYNQIKGPLPSGYQQAGSGVSTSD